jgi:integrase
MPLPASPSRPARGIRRTATGWQVYTKRNGTFRSERLPSDTSLGALKAARDRLEAQNILSIAAPAPVGAPFEEDARAYLKLVQGMPSIRTRTEEIEAWARAFRGLPRASLTANAITAVLEEWRVRGSFGGRPLKGATLNHRRTALMAMFTTLDGRGAANIVKDVPKYSERYNQIPRAQSPRLLYRILARIGHRKWKSRRKKSKGTRAADSKSRARLRLMLWTGWPPAIMKEVRPKHVDWKKGHESVLVMARRKGAGTDPRRLPLFPGAVTALKAFFAAGAAGPFSSSSLAHAVYEAVDKENAFRAKHKKPPIEHIRAYDFRHTFGTELAKRITDERALKEYLISNQIRRYTDGATSDRLTQAKTAALERGTGF